MASSNFKRYGARFKRTASYQENPRAHTGMYVTLQIYCVYIYIYSYIQIHKYIHIYIYLHISAIICKHTDTHIYIII